MGHILGLRHNFVASRLHSLDDLAKGDLVRREGMVASVMEYDPFNQMALHAPNTVYWNPTIGPYDYWAIEYGYKEFGVQHARSGEAVPAADCTAQHRAGAGIRNR
jgi:hypothetical protein